MSVDLTWTLQDGQDWIRGVGSWTDGEWLCCLVTQSHLTLRDPMDYSLPDSSVHGIFQARILGGLPFLSPGDLPDSLPSEPPGKPMYTLLLLLLLSRFSRVRLCATP